MSVAQSQCGDYYWAPGVQPAFEMHASTEFDPDGPGPLAPRVYIAGLSWGHTNFVMSWDGFRWQAAGGAIEGWNPGDGAHIYSLCVHDEDGDESKPARLFAAGQFHRVANERMSAIARWDGERWTPLGSGISIQWSSERVFSMASFDEDGDGFRPPSLFVGGRFESAGGLPANAIARWNGREWSSVGGGMDGVWAQTVFALEVFDADGDGPEPASLYAGGSFSRAGGLSVGNIARWDGLRWHRVPGVTGSWVPIWTLLGVPAGTFGLERPALFAGGGLTWADGDTGRIAMLYDGAWRHLGSGVGGAVRADYPIVKAMRLLDLDGEGPRGAELVVAGQFTEAGGLPVGHIARWNGERWGALAVPSFVESGSVESHVNTIVALEREYSDTRAASLYFGGLARVAGPGTVNWKSWRWVQPMLIGDADGDRVINFDDIISVINYWQTDYRRLATSIVEDVNADGWVGMPDLEMAIANSGVYGHPDVFRPGDVNLNGKIDTYDFNKITSAFGRLSDMHRAGGSGPGDANYDGVVDARDIAAVINGFGGYCAE